MDSIASWILLKSPLPDWSTLIRIAVEKSIEDDEEEEAMDEWRCDWREDENLDDCDLIISKM